MKVRSGLSDDRGVHHDQRNGRAHDSRSGDRGVHGGRNASRWAHSHGGCPDNVDVLDAMNKGDAAGSALVSAASAPSRSWGRAQERPLQ